MPSVLRFLRAVVWVALAAGLLVLAWVWFASDLSGQDRMMRTVPILAGVSVLAVLALFTVRGRARRAAQVAGVVVLAGVAALPVLFRVSGLTGDFYPVLEWRFAPRHDTTLPALPGVAADAGAPDAAAVEPDEPADASGAPAGAPAPAAAASTPEAALGTPAPGTAPGTSAPGTELSTSALGTPAPGTAPGTSAPGTALGTPARGTSALSALSFPQFLGPTRTGVVPGVRLARDWSARPPRLVWRIEVGAGWSGFVIDRGLAITQEQRAGDELVVAYDLMTGAPRWSHGDAVRYASMVAGDGPRATPTIAGPYVASVGSTGLLNVLDFRTGRRLWGRDFGAENGGANPEWGRAGSPLVVDGRVIVGAGGGDGRSLVAYDLRTGARAWSGGSDDAAYSSPILLSLLGRPQVVVLNRASLAGHDPATGEMLWSQDWPSQQPNVAEPIRIADDLVLAGTGYGVGSKLVKLTAAEGRITSSFVWETPRLKPKFTNPVLHDGFVYGLDDGVLVCLDVKTGERRWRAGRYGHGQTLLVGDLLLVTTEDGDVVLVEPTPEAHRELTRFTAFDGKTWNPPAVAGNYLLVRTDREAKLYEMGTE